MGEFDKKNQEATLPLHPRDTQDFVACTKWKEEFFDYCNAKGYGRTLKTGEMGVYSHALEAGLASGTAATARAARESKKRHDARANGEVYGWLCQATSKTAPSLYRRLKEDTDFYDRDDDDKDQGVGHTAWGWITHRLRAPDTNRILDACDDRDEDGNEPIKRYCTEEEWSKRVDRYLKLNDACGKSQAKDGDLVVRLQRLLPVELRRNNALQIKGALAAASAVDDADAAQEVFTTLIREDHRNHKGIVKQELKDKANRAMAAMERQVEPPGGFPPGLPAPYANDHESGFGAQFKPRRVADMSQAERIAELKAMDPCEVCHDKHFGPKGWGKCACDPSVPLTAEIKSKLSKTRIERVVAVRKRIQSETSKRAEKAKVANEQWWSLEDLTSEDHACQAGEKEGEDETPNNRQEESMSAFETTVDASEDPFQCMLRDAGGVEHAKAAVEVGTTSCAPASAFPWAYLLVGLVSGMALMVAILMACTTAGAVMPVTEQAMAAMHPIGVQTARATLSSTHAIVAVVAACLVNMVAKRGRLRILSIVATLLAMLAVPYLVLASGDGGTSQGLERMPLIQRMGLEQNHGLLDLRHNAYNATAPTMFSGGALGGGEEAAVDSGATSIFLTKRSFFQDYMPVEGRFVQVANGVMVPIKGVGQALVVMHGVNGHTKVVKMSRAMHVPDFSTNLLSVDALWELNGVRTRFEDQNELIFPDGESVRFQARPKVLRITPLPGEVARLGTQGKKSKRADAADLTCIHHRLMHVSEEWCRNASKACDGIHLKNDGCHLRACDACNRANARRQPATGHVPAPPTFGWASMDTAGPFPPTMFYRQRYLTVFTDLHTRLRWGYLHRSRAEIPGLLTRFIADTAPIGKIVRLHRDNAAENVGQEVQDIAERHSIRLTSICPHTPQQNTTSERPFGTIFRMVRAALAQGLVPKVMWGWAALGAIDVMNRTLVVRDGRTGFEIAFGRKPDVSNLRPLFCRAWMKIPPPDAPPGKKVSDQGVRAVNLGCSGSGYACYVPEWGCIRRSSDVVFDEQSYPGLNHSTQGEKEQDDIESSDVQSAEVRVSNTDENDLISQRLTRTRKKAIPAGTNEKASAPHPHANRAGLSMLTGGEEHEAVIEGDEAALVVAVARSRSEPANHEAIRHMDKEQQERWYGAEKAENENHKANKTFRATHPITDLPDGARAVKSTWAYKDKIGADGKPKRPKARLSTQDLKGVWRHEGKDFESNFSNAMSLVGWRMLVAITAFTGNDLYQLDFTGAYLQKPVPMDKKIFVKAAPGYPVWVKNKEGKMVEGVYELGKYMYGLQEAGAEWQSFLGDYMRTAPEKFTRSWVDPNIWWSDTPYGRMWIGIYVDDMLVSAPNEQIYNAFKKNMAERHLVFTDGGQADHFLGANIQRVSKHVIKISHTGYLRRVGDIHKASIQASPSTPAEIGLKKLVNELAASKSSRSIDETLVATYRSICGCLLYSTIAVRADAAYAVGMLCRVVTCPDDKALKAASRALEYLVKHNDWAITFDGSLGLNIEAFVDADWAADGPSTTGYVAKVAGGLVAWKSVKQKCITLSSCEAELVAANAAGAECVHLKHLLEDLMGVEAGEVSMKGDLGCDNQGTISFINTPVKTMSRMKHVERDYLKIREWVENKLFNLFYVPTKKNPADLLTKALCPQQFQKLRAFFLNRA